MLIGCTKEYIHVYNIHVYIHVCVCVCLCTRMYVYDCLLNLIKTIVMIKLCVKL